MELVEVGQAGKEATQSMSITPRSVTRDRFLTLILVETSELGKKRGWESTGDIVDSLPEGLRDVLFFHYLDLLL
jgi:hypothetical protein